MASRAERRRQSRAHTKKQPVIFLDQQNNTMGHSVPDNVFEVKKNGQLPTKVRGKHRWIAISSFIMSDEDAQGAFDPAVKKYMDSSNLLSVVMCCYDCEQALSETTLRTTCAGDPSGVDDVR